MSYTKHTKVCKLYFKNTVHKFKRLFFLIHIDKQGFIFSKMFFAVKKRLLDIMFEFV